MAQTFIINKNATLPSLRMDVINDGRHNFKKVYMAMQSCDVTFTMWNKETGVKKIYNAKAYVVDCTTGCEEKFCIEYRWNKRDTRESGTFKGQFTIHFDGKIKFMNETFPIGDLIVPLEDELIIQINDNDMM